MKFEIDQKQQNKINDWLRETVYPEIIEKQKTSQMITSAVAQSCWDEGFPYGGAIGGGLTYEFSPTSLGLVTKVRYHGGYELDLTDYEDW